MSNRRTYQAISFLGLLAGLVLFVYLVEKTGLAAILAAIRLMGAGILLLVVLSGARQYLRTIAWYYTIEREHRAIGFYRLFQIRLIGEAVTDLTFAGPFLGETVKALSVSRRLPLAHSLSSLFIENLLYSMSAALFILSGMILFLAEFTLAGRLRAAVWFTALIVVAAVLGTYAIIRHRGLPLGRLLDWMKRGHRRWTWLEAREEKIRAFEENVYGFFDRHRGLFFYIFFLELLTNFTGVIEAYLILHFTVGQGSLLAAFLLESVNRVVNTVFAFVPLRVGVEEGGAAVTLGALGYSVADGVSLSIIRKFRTLFWVAVGLGILARESFGPGAAVAESAAMVAKKRKRLIVNADDFGLSERVNQAIAHGHDAGIITSASLMATGAAFRSAVELARARPRLGVGVHLNLTSGQPLAAPATIPTLVDRRGVFAHRPSALAWNITFGRVRMEEVERELRAQIEKVRVAGLDVTHLDGHKHVQALPAIWRIVVRLAHEYGIGCLRLPEESSGSVLGLLWRNRASSSTIVKQFLVARGLAVLAWRARAEAARAGRICPERFCGVTFTGLLDRGNLSDLLVGLEDGTSELMCHPGYVDQELRATGTRLLEARERELEALTAPETRALVAEQGIELISFRELGETE